MVGLGVAVVVFAASAVPTELASADQIGSARAQVQALEASVTADAAHIRSLTLAYEQADTRAAVLASQVNADKARVAQLQNQVNSSRSALRQDAIIGYTGGDSTGTILGHGVQDPAIRAEYVQVAVGNLSQAADHYRAEELSIASAESGLKQDLQRSRSAVAATDQARTEAEAEAQSVQNQLSQVQTRLDSLVAQQQAQEAAQARAQAAAARRAQTAAAYQAQQQAAAQQQPTTQGMPVNNGLVTVVHSVVSPSTTSTTAPSTTSTASGGGNAGGVWLELRECESSDNYRADTGNGFYGAYQFTMQTWDSLGFGYTNDPYDAPPAAQDAAAKKLQAEAGWGQWPVCSVELGLR